MGGVPPEPAEAVAEIGIGFLKNDSPLQFL
jgi:hypothetical protein